MKSKDYMGHLMQIKMKNRGPIQFGCLLQILSLIAFVYMIVAGYEVGPVAGTLMWLVFFFGLFLINRFSEEKNSDTEATGNETRDEKSILGQETIHVETSESSNNEEDLPEKEPDEPKAVSEKTKRLLCDISILKQKVDSYPKLLLPKLNAVVQPHRTGKSGLEGVAERRFLEEFRQHFDQPFEV